MSSETPPPISKRENLEREEEEMSSEAPPRTSQRESLEREEEASGEAERSERHAWHEHRQPGKGAFPFLGKWWTALTDVVRQPRSTYQAMIDRTLPGFQAE